MACHQDISASRTKVFRYQQDHDEPLVIHCFGEGNQVTVSSPERQGCVTSYA